MRLLRRFSLECTGFALGALVAICTGIAIAKNPVVVQEETTYSQWGYITRFSNDVAPSSAQDEMVVYHQPLGVAGEIVVASGLAGCPQMKDGYGTKAADPGHKLLHAELIGAYLHRKQVQVRVDGCWHDRPHIISVSVRD
jgi:hypothetical protein